MAPRVRGLSLVRLLLNAVLLISACMLFVLVTLVHLSVSSEPVPTQGKISTVILRPLEDDVDCTIVLRTLSRLVTESRERKAQWQRSGVNFTVDDPTGKNMTELHIFVVGDSWSRKGSWSLLRYIDHCRLRQKIPLSPRDECSLHFSPERRSDGHSIYQLSERALGLETASIANTSSFVRIHIHYLLHRYLVDSAHRAFSLFAHQETTNGFKSTFFPAAAQCRSSLKEIISGVEHQMPVCLCEDTLNLQGNEPHPVQIDAMQLLCTMWDTQRPSLANDLFAFDDPDVDWFLRQARFSPDLNVYPHMTWEDNLARLRNFLISNYVIPVRKAVADLASSPRMGVPMPRVVLSRVPRTSCLAHKFTHYPTLNSSTRCEELTWPLHEITDEAVRAAYGEAVLGLPAVEASDWLRMVNYRPLSATEYPQYRYNYRGEPLDGGEYLCTMSDGAHFDTEVRSLAPLPHWRWCANAAGRLFWEQMMQ